MKYLDLTFDSAAHNLALDEALLDECEENGQGEILRIWEPLQYFIVLGYSRKLNLEVHEETCLKNNIPIFRRASGGGTVLQGPGCFNYSLVLKIKKPLHNLMETNRYILNQHKSALMPLLDHQEISMKGTSDLALGNLKFSGNAQRRKRNFLLYHGTFLLKFNFNLMEQVLQIPGHQPTYRKNRSHSDFLVNLNLPAEKIKRALVQCWKAGSKSDQLPQERTEELVKKRYSRDEWNKKF